VVRLAASALQIQQQGGTRPSRQHESCGVRVAQGDRRHTHAHTRTHARTHAHTHTLRADPESCAAHTHHHPDTHNTQSHRFTYNEPMPVESCTQSLCDLALRFGEDSDEAGMVRAWRCQQGVGEGG
jgi:hypothetical protein